MAEKKLKLNTDYIFLKISDKGWNLYEFAARLGVVYNTLARYLNTQEARISTINKMASLLEVEPEDLLVVTIKNKKGE